MAEKKGEIVQAEKQKPQGIALPPEWGGGTAASGYITSIDDTDGEGKMAIFKLLTEKGKDINEFVNKEIELIGYLMTPAQFVDKDTGEEVQTIVVRLMMADGDWIETHSYGVLKTLSVICQFFGMPPWKTPVKVTPTRQPLRDGKSWVILKLTGTPMLPGQRQRSPKTT